jgi:hypothetical protein
VFNSTCNSPRPLAAAGSRAGAGKASGKGKRQERRCIATYTYTYVRSMHINLKRNALRFTHYYQAAICRAAYSRHAVRHILHTTGICYRHV